MTPAQNVNIQCSASSPNCTSGRGKKAGICSIRHLATSIQHNWNQQSTAAIKMSFKNPSKSANCCLPQSGSCVQKSRNNSDQILRRQVRRRRRKNSTEPSRPKSDNQTLYTWSEIMSRHFCESDLRTLTETRPSARRHCRDQQPTSRAGHLSSITNCIPLQSTVAAPARRVPTELEYIPSCREGPSLRTTCESTVKCNPSTPVHPSIKTAGFFKTCNRRRRGRSIVSKSPSPRVTSKSLARCTS